MKKKSLLFAVFALIFLLNAKNTNAQITGVKLSYVEADSVNYPCVPSDLIYFFNGNVTGTFSSSDSIMVKFYYGDGFDTTYKIPISSSTKGFASSMTKPHTYTTGGSYSTKVVVIAPGGAGDSVTSSPFTIASSCSITGVKINSGSRLDSLVKHCIPASLNYMVSGTVSGTVGKYDSVTVKFYYGDGTDVTYKTPLTLSGKFYLDKMGAHIYSVAGTYTTKIVITAPSGKADSMISAPFTIGIGGVTSAKLSPWGGFDSSLYKCKLPIKYDCGIVLNTIAGCTLIPDTAIINFNFGDGSDTTIKVFGFGTTSFPLSYLNHVYTLSGTYTPRVTVRFSLSSVKDTAYFTTFTLSDSCATVKGKLYLDDDKDCAIDLGEKGINYIPFEIKNITSGVTSFGYSWSDINGNYSLSLVPGNYKITPLVNKMYSGFSSWYKPYASNIDAFCPLSGDITLTVAPLTTYTKDFAYECKPKDTLNAYTYASSTCFITGDTSVMNIGVAGFWSTYHYVCFDMPTTLTVTLDPKLTYTGSVIGSAPSSVSGKVLTYNLVSGDIASFSRTIKVSVSSTAIIGDTLSTTLYIAPPSGVVDPVLSNNTYVYRRKVASSYDPNEKEASPKGDGPKGYIPANTPMMYTIHFQNTGTAAARNITIADTLESDLDATSVQIVSSTHTTKIYQSGNIVKFRFNDIYLPDSGSNYYGSMGSVTFAILPKRDLAPGTEIKNRASIYFDYNDPVVTNFTLNTIAIPTSIQNVNAGNFVASIFPNPANTELTIKANSAVEFSVSVSDMLGRKVATSNASNGSVTINTSGLPSGLYLVALKDNQGNEMNTKVVVKH